MRRDVFHAISDPTRRDIIGLLAKKSMNLNAVAENFDISRPAISKHVKVLTECGLVKIVKDGRERYCIVTLDALSEVNQWVEQYRKFWDAHLDSLESYLKKIQDDKNGKH